MGRNKAVQGTLPDLSRVRFGVDHDYFATKRTNEGLERCTSLELAINALDRKVESVGCRV